MNIKKFLIILVGVLLIVFLIFILNKNGEYKTYTVEKSDFIEQAEISGQVVPAQELDLSFEVVGKVSRVNVSTGQSVKAGQILAELDISEISSELQEVVFDLEIEQAKLAEVSGSGLNQNQLKNEAEILIGVLKKAYVTSDYIVKNNVDVFFDNPNYRFPDFTNALSNYFLRQDINEQRREVGSLLEEWKIKVENISSDNLNDQDINYNISNLKVIEKFLATITSEVDDFSPTNAITQNQIDAYITSISNSRNTVASLIVEMNTSYEQYRAVKSDIPVLESSVDNAQATVQKLNARKNKYFLTAPFDGIITEKDVEPGQVVSAGGKVLSMISSSSFEVEAFVPELNIIRVNVGDTAELKFDAFGKDVIFKSVVSHVDPRETIKDGITTYRILLNIEDPDPEIRSGMTNDVVIIKDKIDAQIVIPRYLVFEDEEGYYVEALGLEENVIKKYIEMGRLDGKGGVIIESGLEEGEEIIIEK